MQMRLEIIPFSVFAYLCKFQSLVLDGPINHLYKTIYPFSRGMNSTLPRHLCIRIILAAHICL